MKKAIILLAVLLSGCASMTPQQKRTVLFSTIGAGLIVAIASDGGSDPAPAPQCHYVITGSNSYQVCR